MPPLERRGPIVCGVDFSDRSAGVLRIAARLSRELGTHMVVTTAVDPLLAQAALSRLGQDQFIPDARRDLEALVRSAIPAGADAPAWSCQVDVGLPANVLRDLARAEGARLIVVGTRGLAAGGRLLFGSTTARLLAVATCPVLAVPDAADVGPGAARLFDRIVCGVDFGAASEAAAREAVALGTTLDVPIALVHAAGGPVVRAAWQDTQHDVIRAAAADAKPRLAALAATLPGPPATEVVMGSAADVLIERASAAAKTLLVVGLGGGLLRRPGTTALSVLVGASGPVLGVPA